MSTPDQPPLVMASVAEARARMTAFAQPTASEEIALREGLGRVLARGVAARRDQPPFAASAMDGYAVRAAETPGSLAVIGESAAGARFAGALGAGACVRIFTGAPLPHGADTVVPQEDVAREGDRMRTGAAPHGQFVRPAALDFAAGAELLKAGDRLDGVALAFAASAGHGVLLVRKRPRIALLSTGDELVPPGANISPDQIYDSVGFGLAGLIETWGGDAVTLTASGDNKDAIAAAAEQAFAAFGCDLLVTIGGASVGDHDLVKPALERFSLTLAVNRVNVRPGKPTWFGETRIGNILGLPGNPASALVCAHLFLRPYLDAMLAHAPPEPWVRARLAEALPQNESREHYLRARLAIDAEGCARVTPFEQQDSSLLSVFRGANALVRSPPNAPPSATGDYVDVMRLNGAV